jgi:uncharacterized iron-regulated protein
MKFSARYCISIVCLLFVQPAISQAAGEDGGCDHHVAQWLDPSSGEVVQAEQVFARLADSRIVLLGEAHTIPTCTCRRCILSASIDYRLSH